MLQDMRVERPKIFLRGGIELNGWYGTKTLIPGEELEIELVDYDCVTSLQRSIREAFPGQKYLNLKISEYDGLIFSSEERIVRISNKRVQVVRISTEMPFLFNDG